MGQTYQNWECIIVDDGSTDNTAGIVLDFVKSDSRIRFVTRPTTYKKGAASCRNLGFAASVGEYIQYLDSDDILSPEKIEIQLKNLLESPEGSLAACKWGIFSIDPDTDLKLVNKLPYGKTMGPNEFLDALGKGNTYLPPHVYLLPRKLVNKAGPWNEFLYGNDDGEFMIRVIINCTQINLLENLTVYYRTQTGDNLSAYSNKEKVLNEILSWKLIEVLLQIRFGEDKFLHVERSKNRLFHNVRIQYPDLIRENLDFFSSSLAELEAQQKFTKRIKRKLRKKMEQFLGK